MLSCRSLRARSRIRASFIRPLEQQQGASKKVVLGLSENVRSLYLVWDQSGFGWLSQCSFHTNTQLNSTVSWTWRAGSAFPLEGESILWEILTLDAAGRTDLTSPSIPSYTWSSISAHPSAFSHWWGPAAWFWVHLGDQQPKRVSWWANQLSPTEMKTDVWSGSYLPGNTYCIKERKNWTVKFAFFLLTHYIPSQRGWCRSQLGYDHLFSASDTEQLEIREPRTSHKCHSFSAVFSTRR